MRYPSVKYVSKLSNNKADTAEKEPALCFYVQFIVLFHLII